MSWLSERLALPDRAPTLSAPSFAYVFGAVLVMLLGVEAVTGAALAAFYSPSTTDAWASVAYVQDRMPLGWLVRGLHYHGASALVIVAGAHLVHTALVGAYKKPREVAWWLGVLLLVLVLVFAVTGYVLRWDQAGYWANQVEVGIAAGTPVVGGTIKGLAIGGNEYGNLTLTRFYALHVIVMPALVALVTFAHVALARRHGSTTIKREPPRMSRWPQQTLRDVIAMAIVFALLLVVTAQTGGAELAAPADPASAYDARPLWYFRWLFELRNLTGSLESVVALVVPALFAGFLVALPLLDHGSELDPRKRKRWLGALAGMLSIVGVLTIASFASDAGDGELTKRLDKAAQVASRARALAAKYGVPVTGAQDIFKTAPMWRARSLYAQRCAGCHAADSKDRKGPIIAAGHHSRAWLAGFLKEPSGHAYWGLTKLARTDDAMKAVDLKGAELDAVVETLYAQSGAADVDQTKRDQGKQMFDKACTDCHSLDEGIAGGSGPGLGGLASRDWYTRVIGNPKSAIHMAEKSEMPRFDKDLSILDRDALAEYLVWLRTATQRDLDALGPL